MNSDKKQYRPCVGIALFNVDRKVFVGERIDTPGAWQMPQGGIDQEEDLEEAAFRELYEETGVKSAEILKIADESICYDLPPELLARKMWSNNYIGQEQTWIAMQFTGDESEINLNAHEPAEFSAWQWTELKQTLDLIVPFKRKVYEQIIEMFQSYITD